MKKVIFLLILISIVIAVVNSFKIPQPDVKLQNEICYEEGI
jgi:hypothetical protein